MKAIAIIAGAICVTAGAYLLQYNTTDEAAGTSWFEVIGHGMGIYFIGKGIFVAAALWRYASQQESLDRLVEIAQWQAGREASNGEPVQPADTAEPPALGR